MATVIHTVSTFLDRDPIIRRDLSRNLINITALAKYILSEEGIRANLDAVISAIRRYSEDHIKPSVREKTLRRFYSRSKISSHTNMTYLVVENREDTLKLLSELLNQLNIYAGETLNVVRSTETVELIIDDKDLSKVMKTFTKDKILKVVEHIAILKVKFPHDEFPEVRATPGVFAGIFNELAMNDVSVDEVVSCQEEYMIFMDEKYLHRAHQVLMRLCGK